MMNDEWRGFLKNPKFIFTHQGYQDQLNSSPLLSLRTKWSNPRHHGIASAQSASQ